MLEVADETGGPNGPKIVEHLIIKLKAPQFEWKRINKTLTVIEFILKHGGLAIMGKLQMGSS